MYIKVYILYKLLLLNVIIKIYFCLFKDFSCVDDMYDDD